MRILFDAFWWYRGPVSNRHLMISMIRTWADMFPNDEIVLAVRAKYRHELSNLPTGARIVSTRLAPQGVSAILELPVLARRTRADVIVTHNFTPLWRRSVVFIHDVLFLTNPEWFTRKERAYFSLMPLTARRARAIVTSSRSEADRIQQRLNPRTAVTPVGLGLGERLEGEASRPAALAGVKDFLLTVGRLNVRKNLAFTCLSAVQSGAISPEFPLVVAGSSHGRAEDWPVEVRRAMAEGSIVVTGYVTDDELAWLYANCRAFLFLSRGEGFGLPPLEAMQAGAEVIAADIPVMREILGEHAVFVGVRDSAGLQREVRRVVSTPQSGEDRAVRIEWASRFTWERTINALRALTTRVAGAEASP